MPYSNQVELVPNDGWDERILIARNGELVNVFLVISQRYVVMVDTLINAATARALLEIAQPYLTNRQLLVVNTHADFDHAWGNQLFVGQEAEYPAPILAHRCCAEQFDLPDAAPYLAQMQQEEPDIFGKVVLTKPTLLFEQELTIDGGDLILRLFPTFGHTPDHIAIYIPEIDTLLAGDAAEIPFPYARSVEGLPVMRASLATLAALDAQTVLYCHADPSAGPQVIHANIAYFDAIEVACQAALARGLDPATVSDAALPDAVGCVYQDVVAQDGAWAGPSGNGHGPQLRMMLAWLQQREALQGT